MQKIPNIAENNSENFIDHKLLDTEGILKKYLSWIFAKTATPLRVNQHRWKKFLKFYWS